MSEKSFDSSSAWFAKGVRASEANTPAAERFAQRIKVVAHGRNNKTILYRNRSNINWRKHRIEFHIIPLFLRFLR